MHKLSLFVLAFLLGVLPVWADATKSSPEENLTQLGFQVFSPPVSVADFEVTDLQGKTQKLSQFRGKIVLLNFWATWCPPCRAEIPSIQKLWNRMPKDRFAILAVSVGEQPSTVAKYVQANGMTYPVFADSGGQLGAEFNATSIPTTYVVDKAGKVIAGAQGGREYDSPEMLRMFQGLAER